MKQLRLSLESFIWGGPLERSELCALSHPHHIQHKFTLLDEVDISFVRPFALRVSIRTHPLSHSLPVGLG